MNQYRSYWVVTTKVHEILALPFVWIDWLVHGPAAHHSYCYTYPPVFLPRRTYPAILGGPPIEANYLPVNGGSLGFGVAATTTICLHLHLSLHGFLYGTGQDSCWYFMYRCVEIVFKFKCGRFHSCRNARINKSHAHFFCRLRRLGCRVQVSGVDITHTHIHTYSIYARVVTCLYV